MSGIDDFFLSAIHDRWWSKPQSVEGDMDTNGKKKMLSVAEEKNASDMQIETEKIIWQEKRCVNTESGKGQTVAESTQGDKV